MKIPLGKKITIALSAAIIIFCLPVLRVAFPASNSTGAKNVAVFSDIISFDRARAKTTVQASPQTAPAASSQGQQGSAQNTGTSNTSQAAQNKTASGNPIACSDNPVICAIYFISYFINKIIAVFITIGAAMIADFLSLSYHIYDSPAILTGFSISLAFANLGFVLAIIIIAIATILRSQSYGMKQLLWKLVAMAILVNFGLVITEPMIKFSDNLSGYFVGQMAPGGSAIGVATTLTGAFEPQAFTPLALSDTGNKTFNTAGLVGGSVGTVGGFAGGFLAGTSICAAGGLVTLGVTTAASPLCGLVGGITGGVLGDVAGNKVGTWWHNIDSTHFDDQVVSMLIGLVASAAVLAITAFTLLAIAIMLLVRYIYLTVLLIILPLAWLTYTLPKLSNHFEKWWNLFLKWTFFPVIALFFLYLALTMVMQNGGNTATSGATNAANGANNLANGGTGGLATQTLDDIALAGLMLGGLFAADSLSLTGSKMVTGAIKGGAVMAAGYVGGIAARQGKKAASRMVPQKVVEGLQGGKLPIPFTKRLQVAAGIGLGKVQQAGGSALVDEKKQWAEKLDSATADRLLASGALKKEEELAILVHKKAKEGTISRDTKVGNMNIGDYMDKNSDLLKRTGQGGLGKKVDAALGSNAAMRQAAASGNDQALQAAADEYAKSLTKTDAGKINTDSMFNDKNKNSKLSKAFLASVATQNPQLLSTLINRSKGTTVENIKEVHDAPGGAREQVERNVEAHVNVEIDKDATIKKAKEDTDAAIKEIQSEIEKLNQKKAGEMDLNVRSEIDMQMKPLADQKEKLINTLNSTVENQKKKIADKVRKDLGADIINDALIANRLSLAGIPDASPSGGAAEPKK